MGTTTKKASKAVGYDADNLEDAHPLAARLNARFRLGVPSDDLHAAGVLVHINDRTEDPAHRWKPCYQACNHGQYADRVSCSLINAGQPNLWPGGGGLVLSPLTLRCAAPTAATGPLTRSGSRAGACLSCATVRPTTARAAPSRVTTSGACSSITAPPTAVSITRW